MNTQPQTSRRTDETSSTADDAPDQPPGTRATFSVLEPLFATSFNDSSQSLVGRDAFAATEEQWANWRWQMRNRLRSLSDFQSVLNLTGEEIDGLTIAARNFTVGVTPYWVSLMDRNDSACPIRRQVVPTIRELLISPTDREDPCGEEHDMKTPGLIHRYPDRVLFLASDRCAGYCRYCTRSRLVGTGEIRPVTERIEAARTYVAAHPEVRDVLISGGDPLLLNERLLAEIVRSFNTIPHVEIVRIGTRVPSYLPQRITPRLTRSLRSNGVSYLSVHFSHPREITPEVEKALALIADNGIVMGSQTVLLRGINDDAAVLKKLFQKLLANRVRPYYLYQCDPVVGSSHFRTPVSTGLEIMRQLRGFTSGYAIPTYVIDAPGGGGKIPIGPEYIVKRSPRNVVLRNYQGHLYDYPEV